MIDAEVSFELSDKNRKQLSIYLSVSAMEVLDEEMEGLLDDVMPQIEVTVDGVKSEWTLASMDLSGRSVERIYLYGDHPENPDGFRVILINSLSFGQLGEIIPQKVVMVDGSITPDNLPEIVSLLIGSGVDSS
jgi:hypothetical protein